MCLPLFISLLPSYLVLTYFVFYDDFAPAGLASFTNKIFNFFSSVNLYVVSFFLLLYVAPTGLANV